MRKKYWEILSKFNLQPEKIHLTMLELSKITIEAIILVTVIAMVVEVIMKEMIEIMIAQEVTLIEIDRLLIKHFYH